MKAGHRHPVRARPVWFGGLDRVKQELKGERFPRTVEEGLVLFMRLSTTSIRWLFESVRRDHPGYGKRQVALEVRRLQARLAEAERKMAVRAKVGGARRA
ncbi:MAG: hypothetical protein ABIO65_06290 [Nitrospiria bacterium]